MAIDLGVDLSSLDAGADRIDVAERFGQQAAPRGVQRILEQDADWITVAVI